MAVGLAGGAAVVDYSINRGDLMLMGAITGLGVGVLQTLVLARQGFSGALWRAVANPPTWALADGPARINLPRARRKHVREPR